MPTESTTRLKSLINGAWWAYAIPENQLSYSPKHSHDNCGPEYCWGRGSFIEILYAELRSFAMEFRHPEITAAALLPLDGFWLLTARDGTTARSLKIDDAWNCSINVWVCNLNRFFPDKILSCRYPTKCQLI